MNRSLSCLLLFLVAGCASMPERYHSERSLFNGRDFRGWVKMHGGDWTIENGVLVGRNGENWSTNPEVSGSWLRTERPYKDFILELDYMINEGGNSGVLFRSRLDKNPSFTGYEAQILDDHGRAPSKHTTASIYEVVAPRENLSNRAGEWNHYVIEARGPRIKVSLNGREVVDFENDRSSEGYIGLQNHDHKAVVKFRNIRITEL